MASFMIHFLPALMGSPDPACKLDWQKGRAV
jgi:hypothetical protein